VVGGGREEGLPAGGSASFYLPAGKPLPVGAAAGSAGTGVNKCRESGWVPIRAENRKSHEQRIERAKSRK
jgi:hypothetical protein